jgi:PBP1b-binding outer membrane lipoprotein LpoB
MFPKIITIAIFAALLGGCLPESPTEAKDQAHVATQKSKEVLTSLGAAAQEGLASGEKALRAVGQAAETSTEVAKEGLTSFGQTVESLKASPKPPPTQGPLLYENLENQ